MPSSLIFITGATGFIGAHVAAQTLEAGYRVRLSVRKEAQILGLKELFSQHSQSIEFVVIPDLSTTDAYKYALSDAEHVFHLASPLPGKGSDFKSDYLLPAEQGTLSLLNTALSAPKLQSIVIASSVLSLLPLGALTQPDFVAKEGTNRSIAIDSEMKFPDEPQASAFLKYHASKILAHRATLEWVEVHAPAFKVITLHPTFVFGRNLSQISAGDIGGSNGIIFNALQSARPSIPLTVVDVRDVALAHLRALVLEVDRKDGVEEFLLSAGKDEGWSWSKVAAFVENKYPAIGTKLIDLPEDLTAVDTRKAEATLGMKWRKMEDTMASFLDHQLELRSLS